LAPAGRGAVEENWQSPPIEGVGSYQTMLLAYIAHSFAPFLCRRGIVPACLRLVKEMA
jgi:hypothetical protein